jgi:hypothetical protein
MKTREQIFYDWLFGDEEYRKNNNPFSQSIMEGVKKWPRVQQPKFN